MESSMLGQCIEEYSTLERRKEKEKKGKKSKVYGSEGTL